MLRQSGVAIERHTDHFAPNATDADWLAAVGQQGWFVLTRDRRIRYRPNELAAVMESGVGRFVLIGQAPHRDLAINFINSHRRVEAFADRVERPFIAKVFRPSAAELERRPNATGRVELWLTYSKWTKRRKD